jgi:hypothetical protein
LLDPLQVLQENKSLLHFPVDKQTALNVMQGKFISAENLDRHPSLAEKPGTPSSAAKGPGSHPSLSEETNALEPGNKETYVLVSHENKLLAVCVLTEDRLKPEVVIANAVTEDK